MTTWHINSKGGAGGSGGAGNGSSKLRGFGRQRGSLVEGMRNGKSKLREGRINGMSLRRPVKLCMLSF